MNVTGIPLARRADASPRSGPTASSLASNASRDHIREMITRKQWRAFIDHPVVEWTIFVFGILLMIAAIPLGALPGPGGIFVAAFGLAMVLKTSMWAKRRYVWFKQKQPKAGRWMDWGLRRPSAKRREAMRKHRQAIGCPPPADEIEQGPLEALIPNPPVKEPEKRSDREGRAEQAGPSN